MSRIEIVTLSRARLLLLALISLSALPLLAVAMLVHVFIGSKKRALRLAVVIDRGANVVFLNGDDEQTISYSALLAQRRGEKWGVQAVKFIDLLFGRGHCEESEGY